MNNIVGSPARGRNYFRRPKLVSKFYTLLENESHIFMAAPRRVGKTSTMFWLKDNPRENYLFLYLDSEAIYDTEDYFKQLLELVLESEAVSKKLKYKEKALSVFSKISERVKKISLMGIGVEVDGVLTRKYSQEFEELLEEFEADDLKIVLMIDEFPQTVENITNETDEKEAVKFLQLNRRIRQRASKNIRFIYTGSIGLPFVAEKLNATREINDLNTITIPPLSKGEAREFVDILLKNYKIPFEEGTIDHLLNEIDYLVPFYLQVAVQELIEEYDNTEQPVTKKTIDKALDEMCDRNYDHFYKSYDERLGKNFFGVELFFVKELLFTVSNRGKLLIIEISKIAESHQFENYRVTLRILEFDGYIHEENGYYQFISPVLKRWWKKFVTA